jgi:hypothetical protein
MVFNWSNLQSVDLDLFNDYQKNNFIGGEMPECKACGKEIYYCKTKNGKLIPVNAETIKLEDRVAMDNGREVKFIYGTHISHFSDCPSAKKFRGANNG